MMTRFNKNKEEKITPATKAENEAPVIKTNPVRSYKVYSDKLGKLFSDVESLEKAEAEYDREQEAKALAVKKEQERVAALKAQRADRAKEIQNLFKEKEEIEKTINEKIHAFTRDYGSFHFSYRGNADTNDWISTIFRIF